MATIPADPETILAAGIRYCRSDDWERGLSYLMRLVQSHEKGRRLPGKFYSYLGYAVARVEGKHDEGLSLCRHAVEVEFYEPDNLFNLARTQLLAGRREEAVQSILKGLQIDPEHGRLQDLRKQLGIRQKPVFPFLSRSNPLNRLSGRIRASLHRKPPRKPAPVQVKPPDVLSRLGG